MGKTKRKLDMLTEGSAYRFKFDVINENTMEKTGEREMVVCSTVIQHELLRGVTCYVEGMLPQNELAELTLMECITYDVVHVDWVDDTN
jgi:hypothetical protein